MDDRQSGTEETTRPRARVTSHPELNDALRRGSLCLFVGADLPRKVTGLPSRAELARELAHRKGVDPSLSLAEVAQRVARGGNRWAFTAFIRDELETTGKAPQSFHRRIVELVREHGVETVISTGYDGLLKVAFQEAGIAINRLVRSSDVSFIDPDRPTLIKLYGEAQQPDTLVVTADDHYGLWQDRERQDLLDEVRTVLRKQTVLFLGYNLADPDFNLLWRDVLDRAGRMARTAYAVWPDLAEDTVRMWHDRGIVILDADPVGVLGAFAAPSAPTGRPEPEVEVPPSEVSVEGGDMDYKRGFQALKECFAGADVAGSSELATLEERFWENQRAERLFGSSENTRNARSQIIFSLNELALQSCGVSFNALCRGTQPAPPEQPAPAETSEPAPAPTPRRERVRVPFKLQIARRVGRELEVRALETPAGEPRATSRLPYNTSELTAVLEALRAVSPDRAELSGKQMEALRDLDLATEEGLIEDLHVQVGQALYQALFPGDVGTAFQMAWNEARGQRGTVALQLRFDEDAVALARYPWELVYHRRHLLPGGAVELARYISYPEASTTLPIAPPLRVLHVESRPTDLASLPLGKEQEAVRGALEPLEQKGLVVLERLSPPTYDALIDRIENAQDHVLHFNGHGAFARRCPACGRMNDPQHTSCQGADCDHSLEGVPPLGYLAFERGGGSHRVDWVDSRALGHLLYGSAVRLAVLSACRSSDVRGETLFGGVGPALVQAGVAAVVGMQVPITARGAARFMQGFYGALSRFEPLPGAMTSGRRRLFRGREWFIPALTLRSRDDEGQLFKSMEQATQSRSQE